MRRWTGPCRRLKLPPFKDAVADTLKVKPPRETKRRERSTITGKKWAVSQWDPTAIVDHSTMNAAGISTGGTLEQFELANKPGALAQLAGRLARKGINIDCAYATVHKGSKKAVVVLGTSKAGETGGG